MFAFQLQSNGKYQECTQSLALEGLSISLLEQTLAHLNEGTNGSAATWLAQQITNFKPEQLKEEGKLYCLSFKTKCPNHKTNRD